MIRCANTACGNTEVFSLRWDLSVTTVWDQSVSTVGYGQEEAAQESMMEALSDDPPDLVVDPVECGKCGTLFEAKIEDFPDHLKGFIPK